MHMVMKSFVVATALIAAASSAHAQSYNWNSPRVVVNPPTAAQRAAADEEARRQEKARDAATSGASTLKARAGIAALTFAAAMAPFVSAAPARRTLPWQPVRASSGKSRLNDCCCGVFSAARLKLDDGNLREKSLTLA